MAEDQEEQANESAARPPGVFDQAFLTGVPDVTEVLLIRHGEQDFNLQGVVGDWIDPPLSEQGRLQARLLGEALSTKHLDAVFASSLKRAVETAREVARHHDLEVQFMDRTCRRTRPRVSSWETNFWRPPASEC